MGWSKPISLGQPQRVNRLLLPYVANVDQPSMSQPLGYVSTNQVPTNVSAAPTKLDELDFDFVRRQYAFLGTFSWTTSNVYNDSLYNINHTDNMSVS